MRLKLLLCLLCLSLFTSGCGILPNMPLPSRQTPQPTATLPDHPPLEPTPFPEIEGTFIPQEGAPFYLPNFTHPKEGCKWMGIAGQVFDEDGAEVLGLTVIAGNINDGEQKDRAAITGLSTAYGLGGFEIQLSNRPVDTVDTFWVQVLDQDSEPLSERFYFSTLDDCEMNLILVNFVPLAEPGMP